MDRNRKISLTGPKFNFKSSAFLVVFVFLSIAEQGWSLKTLKARIVVQSHVSSVNSMSAAATDKNSKLTAKPTAQSNVEVLIHTPNSDFVLTPEVLHGSVYLECVAAYPVQWVYDGPGYPNVETFAETRRAFTDFKDPTTYLYFAKIHLVKVDEANTGKYSCRSLADEKIQVYYYIFVPGPKFFVAESGHLQGKTDHEWIYIPCAISHYDNFTAELFKVGEMNHPEHISMATFDPKTGFKLDRKYLKGEPWGTYICTCGNDSLTNSIMVDLVPPKNSFLRPTVKGNYVFQDENIKQRFICEAKNNITLEFSPGIKHLRNGTTRVSYRLEEDSDFPFIVSLEADPREFANYSLISCLLNPGNETADGASEITLKRRPVFHTWEYSAFGNDRNLTFRYSKKLDSFLCCTSNSFVSPKMTHFRPCFSLQECQLRNYRHEKKHFKFDLINYSLLSPEIVKIIRHYNNPTSKVPSNLLPNGCTGVRKFESDHDGFFRCSIPKSPIPVTLEVPDQEMNVQDFFYSSLKGKPILSFQELTSNEEIIQISFGNLTSTDRPTFKLNEEVEVACHTNSFFFSKGHQWSFERLNGTMELVPKDLLREETIEPIENVFKKISLIRFPDVDITKLHCHAPCWYSAEWRNFSVPVQVTA